MEKNDYGKRKFFGMIWNGKKKGEIFEMGGIFFGIEWKWRKMHENGIKII